MLVITHTRLPAALAQTLPPHCILPTQPANRRFWQELRDDPAQLILLDGASLGGDDMLSILRPLRALPFDRPRYLLVVLPPTHDAAAQITEVLDAGADDYVRWPCEPEDLRARVAQGQRALRLMEQQCQPSHLCSTQLPEEAAFFSVTRTLLPYPLLAALVESSDDAIIAKDINGIILSWNAGAERIYGYKAAEVVGRSVDILLPPNRPNEILQMLKQLQRGEQIAQYETVRRRKDGQHICVALTISPIRDHLDAIMAFSVTARDITRRKRAEEDLRQSQERFALIADGNHDGLWDWHIRNGTMYLSPRWKQMLGYADHELTSSLNTWLDLLHPDDCERVAEHINDTLAGDVESYEVEFRLQHRDGSYRWVLARASVARDAAGQAVRMAGSHSDITDRKERELDLRRSEQRYRTIVEHIPNGAAFLVDHDLRYQVVGGLGLEAMGYTREQMEGKLIAEVVPPELVSPSIDLFRATLAGQTLPPMDFPYRGRVYSLQHAAVHNEQGEIVAALLVAQDTTEQQRTSTELVRAKEAAEQAAQVKADFLANMSHEIRTPLNAIIGMTGLLLDTDLHAEQHEYVETVRNSSDMLLTLINDILDFSKIEAGCLELEPHPFNLRAYVEEALDLVAPQAAARQIALAYSYDDATPLLVRGDGPRLRQVLVNLLSNGVKFTHQGDVIVTVCAEPHDDNLYAFQIAVHDTGIGIPPEQLDKLFQSFSQGDSSTTRIYGGTGLGLAISRRLVGLMGGEISVTSTVNVGTTFTVSLVIEALPYTQPEYLRDQVPGLNGRRVLIVDDHETSRTTLVHQLTRWGIIADVLASADAEAWLASGQQYDLAMLDIQASHGDGLQLAQRVRANPSINELPLVLLSSLGQASAARASELFVALLTRPIKASHLYDTLMTIFGSRTGDNSELTLHLPPNAADNEHRAEPQEHPLRILLAEDNTTNQKVVQRMLARLGYRADLAADGLEALAALNRQSYDIILMDVQMPNMDGVAATQAIRTRRHELPQPHIIALTSNALPGDREHYLALGMDDYLSKPLHKEQLHKALQRFCEQETHLPESNPVAHSTYPLLDLNVANEIRTSLGDDGDEVLNDLLAYFMREAPDTIAQIQQAAQQSDHATIQRLAHTLKGSSGSLGALALMHQCAVLEYAMIQGRKEELPTCMAELTLLCDQTIAQMEHLWAPAILVETRK